MERAKGQQQQGEASTSAYLKTHFKRVKGSTTNSAAENDDAAPSADASRDSGHTKTAASDAGAGAGAGAGAVNSQGALERRLRNFRAERAGKGADAANQFAKGLRSLAERSIASPPGLIRVSDERPNDDAHESEERRSIAFSVSRQLSHDKKLDAVEFYVRDVEQLKHAAVGVLGRRRSADEASIYAVNDLEKQIIAERPSHERRQELRSKFQRYCSTNSKLITATSLGGKDAAAMSTSFFPMSWSSKSADVDIWHHDHIPANRPGACHDEECSDVERQTRAQVAAGRSLLGETPATEGMRIGDAAAAADDHRAQVHDSAATGGIATGKESKWQPAEPRSCKQGLESASETTLPQRMSGSQAEEAEMAVVAAAGQAAAAAAQSAAKDGAATLRLAEENQQGQLVQGVEHVVRPWRNSWADESDDDENGCRQYKPAFNYDESVYYNDDSCPSTPHASAPRRSLVHDGTGDEVYHSPNQSPRHDPLKPAADFGYDIEAASLLPPRIYDLKLASPLGSARSGTSSGSAASGSGGSRQPGVAGRRRAPRSSKSGARMRRRSMDSDAMMLPRRTHAATTSSSMNAGRVDQPADVSRLKAADKRQWAKSFDGAAATDWLSRMSSYHAGNGARATKKESAAASMTSPLGLRGGHEKKPSQIVDTRKLQLYEMHNQRIVQSERREVPIDFIEELLEDASGEFNGHSMSSNKNRSQPSNGGNVMGDDNGGQRDPPLNPPKIPLASDDHRHRDAELETKLKTPAGVSNASGMHSPADQDEASGSKSGGATSAFPVAAGLAAGAAAVGMMSVSSDTGEKRSQQLKMRNEQHVSFREQSASLPVLRNEDYNDRDGVPAADGGKGGMPAGGGSDTDETAEHEFGLTEEELAELDKEVIQEIYDRVEKAEAQITSYKHLLFFLLFVGLYLLVLFLQVNSSASYQITSAHHILLPPGMDQSSAFHFDSKDDFYSWLNHSIIQVVWQDPVCGDGVCQRPLELSALSDRKGCAADCGYFPNVTQVFVFLSTNFDSHEARIAASWNLCSLRPVAFCWFPSLQRFSQLAANNMFEFSLTDGDWVLILNAPRGGVKGSVEKNLGSVKESFTLGVETKESLVAWGSCTTDPAVSKRAGCYQTCAMLILCMRSVCHGVMDMPTFSSTYVDCLDRCQLDPSRFEPFFGETCNAKVFGQVRNVFPNVHCHPVQPPPPPRDSEMAARGFVEAVHRMRHPAKAQASISTLSSAAERHQSAGLKAREAKSMAAMHLMAESANSAASSAASSNQTITSLQRLVPEEKLFSPAVGNFSLWELLGPSHAHRLTKLQVAVNRLMFTMVKHECLGSVLQSVLAGMRQHLTAVLCTVLGGPLTMEECQLADPATKKLLTTPADFFHYLTAVHRGRRFKISNSHYEAFLDLAVTAVESVTVLDPAAVAALYRILSALRDAIVDPSIPGCPQGLVIKIQGGASYNTTVETGSIITWEWDDDLPHSIKLSGMGEEFPYFQGFGGSHYLVSRNDICTPLNIGPDDATGDPAPCVLRHPGSPVAPFRYTRIFNLEETVFYEGSQFGDDVKGIINIVRKDNAAQGTELSFECAPSCQLSMVRNGRCDAACNTAGCAFDGGDCACSSGRTGKRDICGCGEGQKMGDDGACCELDSIGSNLQFPFSLRTFGENIAESNAEFVGSKRSSLTRLVNGRNRLVIGMIFSQKRWSSSRCSGSKFSSLSGSCTGDSELTPFGKNPYFLPGSTLYDPAVAQGQSSLVSNHTADLRKGPHGFPFGFFPVKFEEDVMPLVFDINLDQKQAMRRLQYLESGFFVDNQTREIEVAFLTYNGDEQLFVLTHVNCKVQVSGKMSVASNIQPISFEKYQLNPENMVRMVLEIVYVLGLFWNLWEEIKEMIGDRRRLGAYSAYFASMWNWIDLASLAIQFVCVGLWITTAVINSNLLSINPRYDIYASLEETPFPWSLIYPAEAYEKALSVYHDVEYSIELQGIYFSLQGINVFLYVMRILKLMDFQPHMGIFTRTLKAAGNGLFHFFLLWGIVFLGFATFGCLAFGRYLEQFRTMQASMTTCFLMILGDTSVAYTFDQLAGWDYIAAMIFWVSFITIIVFILFNFLIAIIVDAFMDVKDIASEHPTLFSEVYNIFQKLMLRIASPYPKYKRMRRHLHVLGGNHKLTNEEINFLNLYRRLNKYSIVKDGWFARSNSVQEKEERVFRIMDMAIDGQSLSVILDRARMRQEQENGAIPSIRADALGKAVLRQFGEMARLEEIDDAPLLPSHKRSKKEIEVLQESFKDLKQEMRDSLLEMRNLLLLDESCAGTDNESESGDTREARRL